MTQETKDMIVLLQLEFSAEIEQADHDPKYSYRIFQRKTGNPIYQACRFSDMFRFFNIGPSMKIEDIDIRIQWGRKIVMPAMIDTPRIRERSRLKLVRFYIESGYGPEGIAQYKNQLFETEIRKIFSDLGFEITRKTPEYSLSATKGHTNLYCHPTHIMGLCDASSIETIRQNLSASQTFILTSSETIHEIYDITPEQEMKYYHQFFNGFVHLVLIGIFRTKRRNLYKSKDMMYDIGRTIKIRTLRAEQGYKFGLLAEKFVEEIYQKMVENGVLIESPYHRKCRASTSKDKITAKS